MSKSKFVRNVKKEYDYIPEECKGDAKPLTFNFRVLTKRELINLRDSVSEIINGGEAIRARTGGFFYDTVKLCLVGWDNLLDENGKAVKFSKDADGTVAEDLLDCFDYALIMDLGSKIVQVSETPESATELLGKP